VTGEEFASWIADVDSTEAHQVADAARQALRDEFDDKWALVWKCTGCGASFPPPVAWSTYRSDCAPGAYLKPHGYTTRQGTAKWRTA
jgi:hypothetical protein